MAEQEIDQAAGQQTNSKGRAGDVACIRPTDGQKRQGRRYIKQQVNRRTVKAGQEIDHAAGQQTDRKGRPGD
jgi:hypothetical protein